MIFFYFSLFLQAAHATPTDKNPIVAFAQGEFSCSESEEDIAKKKALALKKTTSAAPLLIRPLVSSNLKDKPHMCRKYQISTTPKEMNIQCDAKPLIAVQLDGSPTQYPTPKGTMDVVAQVQGNTIVQKFKGKNGGLEVRYELYPKRMRVVKTISSSYLKEPLVVQADYISQ